MIGHFIAISMLLAAPDTTGVAGVSARDTPDSFSADSVSVELTDTIPVVYPDTIPVELPDSVSVELPDSVNVDFPDPVPADSEGFRLSSVSGTIDDPRVDRLLSQADSLRRIYEFTEALGLCRKAMEYTADSLKMLEIEDCRIFCENGANMLQFAYFPSVAARKKLPLNEFYLYYPLVDRGWHPVSGRGAAEGYGGFPYVTYSMEDSVQVTAADMEKVYSVISADGKSMFFSSASLYGMGGYDLYVSHRESPDSEWGAPVNLGLPFSSPYDDFLYMDTEDGKYTLFASNRGCAADSINVYVLEFDSMPVRTAVRDAGAVRKLMELAPRQVTGTPDAENAVKEDDAIPENADTERYMRKMAEVRALRDSIYLYNKELDEDREHFAMSDDVDERIRLTNEILRKESWLPKLGESLDKAAAELQKIEMEFLFSGILIDPDKIASSLEEDMAEEPAEEFFEFVRHSPGDTLSLVSEENDFDYSFQILPEGRFAPEGTLPDGVVYQIQIFNVGRKAAVSQLKGLSPVFEKVSPAGRYNYSAGIFTSYREVTDALSKVKKLGFKNAYIVAYLNGDSIAVSKARELEK